MQDDTLKYLAAIFVAGLILGVSLLRASPRPAVLPAQLSQDSSGLTLVFGTKSFPHIYPELPHPTLAPFFFHPICVNLADDLLLQSLPGIGPGLAGRIMAYRQENGPITSIDEFIMVPGIGPKRAASLADRLCFLHRNE